MHAVSLLTQFLLNIKVKDADLKKKIHQCSTLKKARLRSDFYRNNREISV